MGEEWPKHEAQTQTTGTPFFHFCEGFDHRFLVSHQPKFWHNNHNFPRKIIFLTTIPEIGINQLFKKVFMCCFLLKNSTCLLLQFLLIFDKIHYGLILSLNGEFWGKHNPVKNIFYLITRQVKTSFKIVVVRNRFENIF